MSGGYTFIIGILLYLLIVQKLDSRAMNPVKAALILMSIYFAISSVVMAAFYYAWGASLLPNLLNVRIIVTTLLQFVAAALVFYKVEETEDSYASYLLWGGAGIAIIFFFIPMFAQQIQSSF